ncbi:PucR family transcriptional regulator [Micropruina sp.]|uniref:PucR family transcriptional regulator n=1 Tax=Micropruina sp. TaxID=2737536 RepID=UPI0039E6EE5B
MIPSVRDVIALPIIATSEPQVIGGAAGLDRAIRWVHLSDAADLTGLLQGGELVLTTGSALAGDRAAIEAYLAMLAEEQVVGLIVELGTQVTALPPEVARLADALGLPVVALQRRIRFVDVTEQVHRMIVADRYDEVQFAQATHQAFTTLNLARAAPRDIVNKASDMLGGAVVLEDLTQHVLAFCAAGTPAITLLDGWADRSRRNALPAPGGWLAVPVGVGPEQWGRLVLPSATTDLNRARTVLERAAQSLQLQRMLEADREALLVQALGGLLDDLATGRVSDPAEALLRAQSLGMAASARYAPLAISVERSPGADALAQGAVDRLLLAVARKAVAASGLTSVGAIQRSGVIALLIGCPYPAGVEGALQAVCAGIEERVGGRLPARAWAAGTAREAGDLVTAAARLHEARHVAEVGRAMPGQRKLFRSADVRLRGLLAQLSADPRLRSFADTELGRLREQDARTGEDLIGVLRTYLVAGGSKSESARNSGLSRPTFYARLARIERILGVSLDEAESRTSLHAALIIDEIVG